MSLSVCADQGPDGGCAIGWAQRVANLNVDPCWDFSHLGTNAWKAGMQRAGLMANHRLMAITWNARHGPWEEGIRWGQACGALEAHTKAMSHEDCPLFQELLPKILLDRGESERIHEAGISDEIWTDMCEVKLQEGMRVEIRRLQPSRCSRRALAWCSKRASARSSRRDARA